MTDGFRPRVLSPPRSLLGRRLLVTFAIYVMLGVPEGALGTAWTGIGRSFDKPVASLASVGITYTLGYLIATLASGRVTELFETERATQLGVGLTAVGLLGYTLSPGWVPFLLSALLIGCGGGMVDAVINADIALRYGQRVMHLLHAAFGIGAAAGPTLVGLLLEADVSWRVAYGVLATFEGSILLFLFTLSDQRTVAVEGKPTGHTPPTAAQPNLALGALLLHFSVYVAAEFSVGAWTFSLLTLTRGYGAAAGGLAVGAYWFGLTVGRLALSAIDDRLTEVHLLRGASALAVVASLWFHLDWPLAVFSLPVLGLAFAGIFPSLVLLTPGWLGSKRVVRAVGYQLAASSGGAIVAYWTIGRLVSARGITIVSAVFVALCVMVAMAHALTEWSTRPVAG